MYCILYECFTFLNIFIYPPLPHIVVKSKQLLIVSLSLRFIVVFIKAYCIQDSLPLYRSPFSLMPGFRLFPRIFYLGLIVPVY